MLEVRVLQPVAPGEADIVRALAGEAAAADGHPPFGDAVWRDLSHPAPTSAGFLALTDGAPVGYLHAATDGGTVSRSTTLSLAVDPQHRHEDVASALLERALSFLATAPHPEAGPARAQLWIFGADDAWGAGVEAIAREAGFAAERELRQMRIPLPLAGDALPHWPAGVTVRAFVPGRDDAAWLAVNNRSFAADPDQSGWDEAMLRSRMAEPWFDPSGFLLAVDDRGLAGFCWTKIHAPAPPYDREPLGEIYVIGVDPDHQGSGLGRTLVVAGLGSLADRGMRTGMLFVDAANTPAVALYEKLGFTTSRVDRAYGKAL
jgi:mycothiol synthase